MVRLWGDTPETADIAKKNLEKQLEKILLENGKITLSEIFERYWNNHHLLKHYLQIFLMVEQLADEGKIIIDEDKNISLAKVTFLDYDGVPWNNNNAEHMIKRFVRIRRRIKGVTTAKGTREYCVLLSICETLRLRNLSFLDFLVSGCLDLDEYTAGKK